MGARTLRAQTPSNFANSPRLPILTDLSEVERPVPGCTLAEPLLMLAVLLVVRCWEKSRESPERNAFFWNRGGTWSRILNELLASIDLLRGRDSPSYLG